MDPFISFYLWIDPFLIHSFRLADNPSTGFLTGTFVLAIICLLAGGTAKVLARHCNRSRIEVLEHSVVRMHGLSLGALGAGDDAAYRGANLCANETFGQLFFARTALFAASLWPVPLALGWLDLRFVGTGITIPSTGIEASTVTVFISLYIALRVLAAVLSRSRPCGALRRAISRTDVAPARSSPGPVWPSADRSRRPKGDGVHKAASLVPGVPAKAGARG